MKRRDGSGARKPAAQPGAPVEQPWESRAGKILGQVLRSLQRLKGLVSLLQELLHPDTDIYCQINHKADVVS